MRIILLLLFGLELTFAEIHSHGYIYTETSGISGFPEFVSVGLVDGQQVSYFDSNIMKMVPKNDWVNGAVDPDFWNRNAQNLIATHQVYKNNIEVAKQRFNQTGGVHTFQRMYSCEWDDVTGTTDGNEQIGYDGEDFIVYDLKNSRWVSPKVQAFLITESKWNEDRGIIEGMNNYLKTICIEWLKKYVDYGKETLQRTVSPQVFLLQKASSSPVLCHATSFYPSGVKITWMKNGQEHEEDVDLSQVLPNEDGTFQQTSTLKVNPDELKQYSCVVEHQGKSIIVTEITTNGPSVPLGMIFGIIAAVVLLVVIAVLGYKLYQKKGKLGMVRVPASDSSSGNSTPPPAEE